MAQSLGGEMIVAADDFARRFSMRPGGLMWLLGAGASAAADASHQKPLPSWQNPAVRRSLQEFIDGLDRFPPTGAPDEYAALFEAAYPSENDRRTYIAAKLNGAKPSCGHMALATFMKASRTKIAHFAEVGH
jgi:hypothetical protein